MALATDLTGLGVAPAASAKIGHPSVTDNLQGTGTTQAGAKKITTTNTIAVPIAGQTAYQLPAVADAPSLMKEYYFYNNAATAVTALIFAAADGSTLNSSASSSFSVAQNKTACFVAMKSSSGGVFWVGDVSA